MAFTMARPWKDPKTGVLHLRQRTPRDILSQVRGITVSLPLGEHIISVKVGDIVQMSLRTREVSEAKRLHAVADAALKRFWEAQRSGPITLSQRQITGLSGRVYADLISSLSEDPGEPTIWTHVIRLHREAREADKLEQWVGPQVDQLLVREGLLIDEESRKRLIGALDQALVQAAEHLQRNAKGDYRPDPDAGRFPEWVSPTTPPKSTIRENALTVEKLFERWRGYHADKKAKNTLKRYAASLKSLAAFAGERDIRTLTGDDLHAWAEHRRDKEGISARAVNKNDLVAASSMFRWAMDRSGGRVIDRNPATGVRLDEPKTTIKRERTFRPDEVKAILRAALDVKPHVKDTSISNAARWCPWLAAYSGARIAELCYLRGEDIWVEEGVPVMHLWKTKTGIPRKVPIHSHLVEQGFIEFVRSNGSGPLFYDESRHRKGAQTDPAEIRAQQLAIWVREAAGLKDRDVDPQHGWRHSFKTIALGAGIEERIRDAITGHKVASVGRRYETPSVQMMAEALKSFPRYDVE